eukprot:6148510-Pyramimonas_sp.AAC.1
MCIRDSPSPMHECEERTATDADRQKLHPGRGQQDSHAGGVIDAQPVQPARVCSKPSKDPYT